MPKVKTKDIDLEVAVRSQLHRRGLRFRKHAKGLLDKPNAIFSRAKVAVFIDRDVWHGHNFEELKPRPLPFWQNKIGKNIERDNKNFVALEDMGWPVVRIRKQEIEKTWAAL